MGKTPSNLFVELFVRIAEKLIIVRWASKPHLYFYFSSQPLALMRLQKVLP
jgi:hypothetical protein